MYKFMCLLNCFDLFPETLSHQMGTIITTRSSSVSTKSQRGLGIGGGFVCSVWTWSSETSHDSHEMIYLAKWVSHLCHVGAEPQNTCMQSMRWEYWLLRSWFSGHSGSKDLEYGAYQYYMMYKRTRPISTFKQSECSSWLHMIRFFGTTRLPLSNSITSSMKNCRYPRENIGVNSNGEYSVHHCACQTSEIAPWVSSG